jgi:hypothetical protein
MIQFLPSHIGLAYNGKEPTAVNYVPLEYAQTVRFDAMEHYWGRINEVFVTDGKTTFTRKMGEVEVTPGTVLTVESFLSLIGK